jgi:hypothetical protein
MSDDNYKKRNYDVAPFNQKHHETIENWKQRTSNREFSKEFLLGIARDGEYPPRTLYRFHDPVEAVNAYNGYKDWGYSKDFLTITLYRPDGEITEKVLKNPKAYESYFERHQFWLIAKYLKEIKDFIPEKEYDILLNKLAKIFYEDNLRFNPVRFFENAGSKMTEAIEYNG